MVLGFTLERFRTEGDDGQIEIVKRWLPEEKLPPLTDEQILLFLRKAEGRMDEAKVAIRTCYNCKRNLPLVFNGRSLDDGFHNVIKIFAMPQRTDDGCAVVYASNRDTDYKRFSLDAYFKGLFMAIEAEVYHEPVNGLILLFDLAGCSLMHLTKLKFGTLKNGVVYIQEGTPVEIRAVHVLNTVSFINKLMAIMKTFIDQTFLRKVTFHNKNMNLEEFHEKHVAKRYLPMELGGLLPSTDELQKEYAKKLEGLREYFENEERQRCS